MKVAVLFVALCALSSARVVYPFGRPQVRMDQNDAFEFLDGLMKGLEANPNSPGECATELSSLSGLLSKVVNDVDSIVSGNDVWGQFAKDMGELIEKVEGFNSDCNFSGLISKIESFLTPTGIIELLKNVFENIDSLKDEISGLGSCPDNWETCGENVGKILREVIGWSLNHKLNKKLALKSDLTNFFDGMIAGLADNNSNDACLQDLSSVKSDFDEILDNIKKVFSGDIFVISKVFDEAEDLLKKLGSFSDECNLSQLGTILDSLLTVNGWEQLLKNYISNASTINSDVSGIVNNCSSDWTTCGNDAGSIVRLVLGWTL